ncbi:MAG: hypothetical protein ABI589_07900 [Burkholderiales bacterium]
MFMAIQFNPGPVARVRERPLLTRSVIDRKKENAMQSQQRPPGTPAPARSVRIGKRHEPEEFGMPERGGSTPKKQTAPTSNPPEPTTARKDQSHDRGR